VIRVGLALEGHGLWIPTQTYQDIIEGGVIPRGVKSSTFVVPPQYWDGCPSVTGQISIQAAFVSPEWTWIFVDHNVMITFHVMALRVPCTNSDLQPGSKVSINHSRLNQRIIIFFYKIWPCVWSATHGPSLVVEKALAEEGLDRWRLSRINDEDPTPIFLSVKNNQKVFNGYGAQETCDMLFEACIFPCMPTIAVCQDPGVWHRFKTSVFDYQDIRLGLVNSKPLILPYVSGRRPFRFNRDGHNKFLRHVSTYRRQSVKVDRDTLAKINDLNLLDFNATLQDNGTALPALSMHFLLLSRLY
jgi:hypothetical protein